MNRMQNVPSLSNLMGQLVVLTVCSLPLSVTSRVLNTHDLPNLLVQLVESPPWSRRIDGTLTVFVVGGERRCVCERERERQ